MAFRVLFFTCCTYAIPFSHTQSDTAFYRNKNYHEPTNTISSLKIANKALVFDAVFNPLISF